MALKKQAWGDDENFDLTFRETHPGRNYASDFEFSYDRKFRAEYIKKNPKEVEKIKATILLKYPYLKYNPGYLKYRIDQEILPSVFIRSNTSISLDTGIKVDDMEFSALIHCKSDSLSKKKMEALDQQKGKGSDMLFDSMSEILDALPNKEREFISMIYGCGVYLDKPVSQKKVAKHYKISEASVSLLKKKILKKLKKQLVSDYLREGDLDE